MSLFNRFDSSTYTTDYPFETWNIRDSGPIWSIEQFFDLAFIEQMLKSKFIILCQILVTNILSIFLDFRGNMIGTRIFFNSLFCR